MGEEACYWGETWKVCVVVFIFVSGLHSVAWRWMCGRCIDFSMKQVSLLWSCT